MTVAKSEDLGKLLLRLILGAVVLFHGAAKLSHGVEWIRGPLSEFGLPGSLAYGTFIGEVLAPILVILGFRTRLAALVIGFDLLMAIVLVLRHQIFVVKEMGGGWAIEIEAFILLTSVALFYLGGGRYSVTRGRNSWD